MDIKKIIEKIEESPPLGEFYEEYKVDNRILKIIGFRTALAAQIADDPVGSEFALHVSRYLAETLCGPYISGASLTQDPRPSCSFPNITTDRCKYQCAPIFGIRESSTIVYLWPPCHGKDSPLCKNYVSGSQICTMIKAAGCPSTSVNNKPAYALTYSFLDSTSLTYTIQGFEIWADSKRLVYITFSTPKQKAADDIVYGYLRIDFEYDFTS